MREVEDRIERKLYRQGKIVGGVYVGRGQEAIPVGTRPAGRARRRALFPSHRDMAVFLIRGVLAAAHLRAVHGPHRRPDARPRRQHAHGRHERSNMVSIISALAASVPVAAGAALALRYKGMNGVAFSYFGDGATSRGDWHEGVNFATVQKLPVVFICNNNQYAYSTPLNLQMACANVADRGPAYGMPAEIVDGNDVLAVYEATQRAAGACARRQRSVPARVQDLPHDRPLGARCGRTTSPRACSRSGASSTRSSAWQKPHAGRRLGRRRPRSTKCTPRIRRRSGRGRRVGREEPVSRPVHAARRRLREPNSPCPPPTWKRSAKVSGKRWSATRTCSCIGEDIGVYGGAFKVTAGFLEHFGETPRGGYADLGSGDRRRGHRRRPDGTAAGGGDAVRRFHLLRLRPDRELRGQVPLPLGCAACPS